MRSFICLLVVASLLASSANFKLSSASHTLYITIASRLRDNRLNKFSANAELWYRAGIGVTLFNVAGTCRCTS